MTGVQTCALPILRVRIEQALTEGLESDAIEVTPEWWAKKRALIASVTPESAS